MTDYGIPGYGEQFEWDYPPQEATPTIDLPIPGDLYTRRPDPLSPGGLGPASGLSTRAKLRQEASGLFTGPNSFARTAWETAKSLPGTIARAVDFPAAALRGEVDPRSDEGLGRAADLAGTVTLGGGAVPRAVPKGPVMRSGMGRGPIQTAAIRVGDQVYAGPTHGDIMSRMPAEAQKAFWDQYSPKNEGFVTSKGDFVDRETAFQMAYKSGQIEDTLTGQPSLSSEDLEFGRRPSLDWDDDTLNANRDKTAGAIPLAMDREARMRRAADPRQQIYPVNRKDKAVIVHGKLYRDETEHVNALDEAAREAGYSGLDEAIEKDPMFENLEASSFGEINKEGRFVPYDSTEEKPLGSATYEDYLNERNDQKYWDENGDDILAANRSVAAGAVPIFSRMEREAAALPQPKAQGSQWNSTLKNRGVPQEEMDWTGVADWLKERGTLPVTKDELLAEIGRRQTQVGVKRLESQVRYSQQDTPEDIKSWLLERGYVEDFDDATAYRDYLGGLTEHALRREAIEQGYDAYYNYDPDSRTRHSTHVLPGGENYREVLLTLPVSPKTPGDITDARRFLQGERGTYVNHLSDDEVWSEARKLGFEPGGERGRENMFRSSHWDEPNVLAHMRVNDRLLPKPADPAAIAAVEKARREGPQSLTPKERQLVLDPGSTNDRVLFAEEIQSDWGQKGRREGFQRTYTPEQLAALEKRIEQRLADPNITETERAQLRREYEIAQGMDRGVPDMPFKKSWPDLVLRRLVADAVDGGYDAVAWTDGATQADRYSLAKQVGQVEYDRGSNQLQAMKGGKTVITETVAPEKLPDYIGKEAADRLINKPTSTFAMGDGAQVHILSGVDLQIGGEGMRAFYDQELPRRAKKLFGRYGATVEDQMMDTHGFEPGTPHDSIVSDKPLTSQIHILRITPEMRAAIQSEGLPLFSNKSKVAGVLALTDEAPYGMYGRTIAIRDGENQIGTLDAYVNPEDPSVLQIVGIATDPPLGANALKTLLPQIQEIFPGVNQIEGFRTSGTRKDDTGYTRVVIPKNRMVTKDRFQRGGRVPNTKAELTTFLQRRASGGTVTIDGEVTPIKGEVTEIYRGKKKTMQGRPLSQNISEEGKVRRAGKSDPMRDIIKMLVDPTQYVYAQAPGMEGGMPGNPADLLGDVTMPVDGLWTDGLIEDPTPGRTDRLPTDMPADSYVIPADIVSSLGQGNTLAGGKILDAMFERHANGASRAEGGSAGSTVPVIVAGGEYTVSPDKVQSMGGGDHKRGHKVLDSFVKRTRVNSIRHLKKLPGPAQS